MPFIIYSMIIDGKANLVVIKAVYETDRVLEILNSAKIQFVATVIERDEYGEPKVGVMTNVKTVREDEWLKGHLFGGNMNYAIIRMQGGLIDEVYGTDDWDKAEEKAKKLIDFKVDKKEIRHVQGSYAYWGDSEGDDEVHIRRMITIGSEEDRD